MNILGFDMDAPMAAVRGALRDVIGQKDMFANLDLSGPQQQGPVVQSRDPFAGLTYDQPAWQGQAQAAQLGGDPFAVLGSQLGARNPQTGYDPLAAYAFNPSYSAFAQAKNNAEYAKTAAAQAKKTADQGYATSAATGGSSTGMTPGVAKWSAQTQQTFGDIMDPDIMLAIMTNESGGNPGSYNRAGGASGLFQLMPGSWGSGEDPFNPNDQMVAAKRLAQQKIAAVNASYQANGLNPDQRTRARDFALAWAGHFDYATGQPNPNSRDQGSGQTADQLAGVFLGNYDKIKAGRQQAGGTGGDWGAGLIGTPYAIGGLRAHPNNPQAGLDCSEFTAYVWGQKGVTLPWNAQQQFNNTTRVTANQLQAGDLVFFQGTDPSDPDYITHVGIYLGNGRMINSQDNGVQYADLSSPYWQQHLAGYGRVSAAPTGGGGAQYR